MMDCEVLSEEEYFGEFYMETFSDCPSDIYIYIYIYIYMYILVSHKMIILQNIVLIRPTKRQKKNLSD